MKRTRFFDEVPRYEFGRLRQKRPKTTSPVVEFTLTNHVHLSLTCGEAGKQSNIKTACLNIPTSLSICKSESRYVLASLLVLRSFSLTTISAEADAVPASHPEAAAPSSGSGMHFNFIYFS